MPCRKTAVCAEIIFPEVPDMATTMTEGIRWKRYMRIHSTTEDALVRPQITCGTNAIALATVL